jgi:ATP-dependent RNA helicase DDX24/MAK5
MVETGHFAELDNILRLTLRQYQLVFSAVSRLPPIKRRSEDQHDPVLEDGPVVNSAKDNLQTFVFSATLDKDLQRNLKRRTKPRNGGKKLRPITTLGEFSVN